MNIKKAKEILRRLIEPEPNALNKAEIASVELGIEAIECVENNRRFGIPNSVNPLPSETAE